MTRRTDHAESEGTLIDSRQPLDKPRTGSIVATVKLGPAGRAQNACPQREWRHLITDVPSSEQQRTSSVLVTYRSTTIEIHLEELGLD